MSKFCIVVIAFCAIAQLAAGAVVKPKSEAAAVIVSPSDESHAEVLRQEGENNGVDKYNFSYETSNGISRSEQGELKTIEDNSAIVVQGTSSWTAPDGKRYEMVFTADEFGYHPLFRIGAA